MYYGKVVDENGRVSWVQTNLKTAKALMQVVVDGYRSREEHLRQKPATWTRTHSDRTVRWIATVDGKRYASLVKMA